VLRLSNMIGASHPYIGGKQLFLQWLYKCLEKNEYVSLKTDEYRSFVAVDDVVHVITSIIQLAVDRTRNFNASTVDRSLYHTNITYDHSCFTQKVYNVGGPQPLSRLDLAKILCECLNISLLIDNENVYENTSILEHIDNRKVWKVGTCCSKDIVQQFKTGTLVSPLYVAMDSSLTEDHFGIRFNSMCDTVKQAFNSIV
jgi:nucleoside-diphosphate-sugar epimerase